MVSISESAAKITAATKTINIKDAYIRNNCLCDDEGNDVLSRIYDALPDKDAALNFKIKIDIDNEM